MQRFPRSVYRHGDEPDPRFSFANERTFLAWIRTALALVAAAVVVATVDEGSRARVAGTVLAGAGLASATGAWLRWQAGERALRLRRPLPGFSAGVVLALAVGSIAAAVVVGLWSGRLG